jgi:hypothetical protein
MSNEGNPHTAFASCLGDPNQPAQVRQVSPVDPFRHHRGFGEWRPPYLVANTIRLQPEADGKPEESRWRGAFLFEGLGPDGQIQEQFDFGVGHVDVAAGHDDRGEIQQPPGIALCDSLVREPGE